MGRLTLTGVLCVIATQWSFAASETEPDNAIASVPADNTPRICTPAPGNVPYQGLISTDEGRGMAAPMLYPAPNFVGFIAAIATHGVIMESAKSAQKMRRKTEADKVLDSYEAMLSNFTLQDLYQRCLRTSVGQSEKFIIEDKMDGGPGVRIEANPSFAMTQDQKALILTNEIVIRGAEGATPTFFQGVIRVVPKPVTAEDVQSYWNREDGENLKKVSAELLADSLQVALQLSRNPALREADTFKTFRYQEGDSRKFERGQLISESCERVVMRTLRGTVLVVPGSC